jgi:hypothetical protein
MSKALESIVSGYVFLKNRDAMEDLLAHRQKLLEELERVSGINANLVLAQIHEEIAILRAGLDRLDGKGARAQASGQVKVLRLSVSDAATAGSDKDAATGPRVELAVHEADLELAQSAPAQAGHKSGQIQVLALAVSVASAPDAAPLSSVPTGTIDSLAPGSFALRTPTESTQPLQQTEEERDGLGGGEGPVGD